QIRTVQLHGDEIPQVALQLTSAGLAVVRALRIDDRNVSQLADLMGEYHDIPLRAILIDSKVAGTYGGSGQTAPWQAIAAAWQSEWPPLILAGGLTPANIGEAI